jgi:hypothetical protein
MSAPAQKPRPAPVRITTRTASSRPSSVIAWRSDVVNDGVIAFNRSGRFSVTVAT